MTVKEGEFDKRSLLLVLGLILIGLWFWPEQAQPLPRAELQPVQEMLSIPSLNIRAPVVYIDSIEESPIQTGLQSGVVHLVGTARPGEVGNCYIVGHSSDYVFASGDYKTIFARLPNISPGEEIQIQTSSANLIYKVIETKIVAADDWSATSQETGGERLLTLQTSYPVGTAQERFLAVAKLWEK